MGGVTGVQWDRGTRHPYYGKSVSVSKYENNGTDYGVRMDVLLLVT